MNIPLKNQVRKSVAFGILTILITDLWGYLQDGEIPCDEPISAVLGVSLFAVPRLIGGAGIEEEVFYQVRRCFPCVSREFRVCGARRDRRGWNRGGGVLSGEAGTSVLLFILHNSDFILRQFVLLRHIGCGLSLDDKTGEMP